MRTMTVCRGCLQSFADIDGPTHAVLTASSGCWARFGQALALHYSDYRFWPAHQLLADAYALQHSQGNEPSAIRSAHVHLGALYAQICVGQREARVIALRRALSACDFDELPANWPTPSTSIQDVDLSDPDRHLATVEAFAKAVLNDWSVFHGLAERLGQI